VVDIDSLLQYLPELANHRDVAESMLSSIAQIAEGEGDRLDMKLADTVLAEIAEAFRVFRPYRAIPKLTIFGSARTKPTDRTYTATRDLARILRDHGWMVVTGAGPGIMAAGIEGAGPDRSLGVNIRLPFEQQPNPFIANDPKLISMRYFFTRKLMLVKESDAYVALPGGFGTLDETFELLTLLQTGKAQPAPVVLLDPESTYWSAWEQFVDANVIKRSLASAQDHAFYRILTTPAEAAEEIFRFYRNYHSCRFVGHLLVIRLRKLPSRQELLALNREFADLCTSGAIHPTRPLPPERASEDHLDLPRIAFRFDKTSFSRLRQLIDRLNAMPARSEAG